MKESSLPTDSELQEAVGPPPARRGRQLLHLVASAAILAVTAWFVDPGAVLDRMRALDPLWLFAGLALSLPLYVALAARWWFTARRAGAPLRFHRAYFDYYLSTFVNQVLPLGIAGDALRAIRHGRRMRAGGDRRGLSRAVRTLLIERLGGLAVLGGAVGIAAAMLYGRDRWLAGFAAIEALIITVAVGLVWMAGGRRIAGAALAELGQDARRALFARGALPIQVGLAAAALASLVGIFFCAGRATGAVLDPIAFAQVVPIVLAATTLPLAFAGWGVREAVTAAIWGALGLEPAAGAAVAVTFGLLSLVASAPGLAIWLTPHE